MNVNTGICLRCRNVRSIYKRGNCFSCYHARGVVTNSTEQVIEELKRLGRWPTFQEMILNWFEKHKR